MQFTLKYRGEDLPPVGSHKTRLREKHLLRSCFHEQLARLWQKDNRLCRIDRKNLQAPILTEGRHDVTRPIPLHEEPLHGFLFRHQIREFSFIPLVTAPMEAHCQLLIRLGRPMKPGSIIFSGGDMDSRLRTLFDALRMPHTDDELPEDATGSQEFFCLLADDDLITKLTIEPHELLSPYSTSHYVEIEIDVTIKAITPMAGTIFLLF